jgi:DNA-binding transcriptional MerR regulator
VAEYTRRELCAELGITYSMIRWYERALGDMVSPRAPGGRGRGKPALFYSEADRETFQRAVRAHKDAHVPFRRLRIHLSSGGDTQEQLDRIESMLMRVLEVVEAQERRYLELKKKLESRS